MEPWCGGPFRGELNTNGGCGFGVWGFLKPLVLSRPGRIETGGQQEKGGQDYKG